MGPSEARHRIPGDIFFLGASPLWRLEETLGLQSPPLRQWKMRGLPGPWVLPRRREEAVHKCTCWHGVDCSHVGAPRCTDTGGQDLIGAGKSRGERNTARRGRTVPAGCTGGGRRALYIQDPTHFINPSWRGSGCIFGIGRSLFPLPGTLKRTSKQIHFKTPSLGPCPGAALGRRAGDYFTSKMAGLSTMS